MARRVWPAGGVAPRKATSWWHSSPSLKRRTAGPGQRPSPQPNKRASHSALPASRTAQARRPSAQQCGTRSPSQTTRPEVLCASYAAAARSLRGFRGVLVFLTASAAANVVFRTLPRRELELVVPQANSVVVRPKNQPLLESNSHPRKCLIEIGFEPELHQINNLRNPQFPPQICLKILLPLRGLT